MKRFVPGAAAVVANAVYRGTRCGGFHVSPLTDPIIEDGLFPAAGSYAIGEAPTPERIPSVRVPTDPTLLEALVGLLSWGPRDLADARFLWRISRRYSPLRFFKHLRSPVRLPRWLWFLYAFLAAKAMKLPAARFAAEHDRLVIVCYYHARSLGLVRAFRRQGKPVIDVQHGLIGPSHFAYGNERAWQVSSDLQPTGFLVWTPSVQDFLRRTTARDAMVRPFDDSRYHVAVPRSSGGRPRVLVSLQWGALLPGSLVEHVRCADGCDWVLRMHPRDRIAAADRADCAALAGLPHVAVESSEVPLGSSLRASDLHVTRNSSVITEAALAGKTSVFWDPAVIGSFRDEIESGFAEFVPLERLPARLAAVTGPVRAPEPRAGGVYREG